MLLPDAEVVKLPANLAWRIVPVESQAPIEGWYAGLAVRVAVHWVCGRSIPCRRLMTGGVLRCLCEDKPMSTRVICYTPVIDRARAKWVVILSAIVGEKLRERKIGDVIRIGRPAKSRRPAWVEKLDDNIMGVRQTSTMRATGGYDIGPYLLHVWQDAELSKFFNVEFRKSIKSSYPEETAGPSPLV